MLNGCLFGNPALELGTQDAVVSRRLRDVFDDQVALLVGILGEAVAEWSIPPTSAGPTKARALLAQLEGMIMFAKLGNDLEMLDELLLTLVFR